VQAEARQADNGDEINEWAAHITKGLITKAVPPAFEFNRDGLVITNAVYFKVRRRPRRMFNTVGSTAYYAVHKHWVARHTA
jgi:serine protease inhibitor